MIEAAESAISCFSLLSRAWGWFGFASFSPSRRGTFSACLSASASRAASRRPSLSSILSTSSPILWKGAFGAHSRGGGGLKGGGEGKKGGPPGGFAGVVLPPDKTEPPL